MSAIWGYIDFLGNREHEDINKINTILRNGYKDCRIDRYDDYVSDSFSMGCGIQYFTKEAEDEILPIVDKERDIYFTADAIVDNREELLEKLGYDADSKEMPDARLIFEMFDRYGKDCLNDILGIYSFVYYDKRNNVCHIVNDCIGGRAIQYYFENGKLCFSTLSVPICLAVGKAKANMQWFADFLGIDSLAYCFDFESTPYEGVKRLPMASCFTFSKDGIKKDKYWQPRSSTLKLESDDKYKELFVSTYMKAIERLVRNDKLTMLLSGGLDSTSMVSLLAASEKGKNVKLRTYTSVPCKGFKREDVIYHTTDESGEVLKTKAFLKERGFDFDTQFISLEDENTWDERTKVEKIIEMPYKSTLNILWMGRALAESYEYGSRIMLVGANGNCTVSLGIGDMYLHELLRKKKYISFLKECHALGEKYNTPVKESIKNTIAVIKEARKKGNKKPQKMQKSKSFISEKALKKYHVDEHLKKHYDDIQNLGSSFEDYKEVLIDDECFYSATEIRTRNSLYTGVVYRDPTADKRVMELCLSFPASCYAKGGIPRRLIREYLKDFMPENTQNLLYHGSQSADIADRIAAEGDRIYNEMLELFETTGEGFVDSERIIDKVEELKKCRSNARPFDLYRVEYTAFALEMIESINRLK